MMENNLSMSFRMGSGGIDHNLRICKGRTVRQNGILERRHLNENLYIDNTLDLSHNYTKNLIEKTIKNEIGDRLDKLNEKHIQQNHPGRVCTVEQWIAKQEYTRNGKKKDIVCEYIVQLGNKYTGSPFDIEVDAAGNMIDVNGKVIKAWDTRQRPAYRNGKITESAQCKRLKKVYRRFVERFCDLNPNFRLLNASIHADELGGCHLHLNGIWVSQTKNGIGIGLSKTQAIKQQYEDVLIKCKDTRKDNAQNMWRKDMIALLEDVAKEHGITRRYMNNKEQHRTIDEFKDWKDEYCTALEDKEAQLNEKESVLDEKEVMLSTDIAKQEWYILKKKYPDVYAKVHSELLSYRASLKKNKNLTKKINFSIDR